MTLVSKHGVILEKTNNSFENLGVFNPAVMQEENTVHLLYRAVRTGNFSTIGYSKLEGPLKIVERYKEPIFHPETPEEFQGVEDPRITKINDTFHLSYTAYDGINVFGAYATSKDLKTFERRGIITPKFTFEEYSELIKNNYEKISIYHTLFYDQFYRYKLERLMKGKIYVWDKNIIFFPKKINGKFAVFHRLFPSIQILYFDDPSELTVAFWQAYISNLRQHIVLQPEYNHESSHIGGGCPPIETNLGWLVIYHSVQNHTKNLIYHACAALLDLQDPRKIISKLKKPLFSPTESYEKEGYVNNVVFPTGTALFDNELYIYYGAADSCVAVASVNINSLLSKLINKNT